MSKRSIRSNRHRADFKMPERGPAKVKKAKAAPLARVYSRAERRALTRIFRLLPKSRPHGLAFRTIKTLRALGDIKNFECTGQGVRRAHRFMLGEVS